jgi:hypothetical protein
MLEASAQLLVESFSLAEFNFVKIEKFVFLFGQMLPA